jgi:excisionase family DNA binding protein
VTIYIGGNMEKLMTYKEVAEQLDISIRFVAKLVALGDIPCVKIGKAVRFNPAIIKQWIDKKSNVVLGFSSSESLVSLRSSLAIVKTKQGAA